MLTLGSQVAVVLFPAVSAAQTIDEFPTPTLFSSPAGITGGADGNMWIGEKVGLIGRVTLQGVIVEYPVMPGSGSGSVALGPDGNVWFTEENSHFIGRITPAGAVTEFQTPTLNSQPRDITAGPDGNMWFVEYVGSRVGRITPAGLITEFPIALPSLQPGTITAGADGNLWFTLPEVFVPNSIGRISPLGVIVTFPLPSGVGPGDITAGADGNVWFTEVLARAVGRITPSGLATDYPLPPAFGAPGLLTRGPDDHLWITGNHSIIVMSVGGLIVREIQIPPNTNGPSGIAAGPDGNIWFTLPFAVAPGGSRSEVCRVNLLSGGGGVSIPVLARGAQALAVLVLAAVGAFVLRSSAR